MALVSVLAAYLEDGLGTFLVVRLGFLHSGDEGQLLQVLQDGQGGTLLGQLLTISLALGRELPHGDASQEAFHVWGAALLQHLVGTQGACEELWVNEIVQ